MLKNISTFKYAENSTPDPDALGFATHRVFTVKQSLKGILSMFCAVETISTSPK
jgi:hypothetical protein